MPFFRQPPEIFQKFEKAIEDGKLDMAWRLEDVTVVDGVLRGTLVVETELDMTVRNQIELDLGDCLAKILAWFTTAKDTR